MASDDDDDAGEIAVWHVLRKVLPRVIKALMRCAGTTKQATLARKTGLSPNQINRYFKGREFAAKNLFVMVTRLGLPEDSGWWLLGGAMQDEYQYASVEIPEPASEIREPFSPYQVAAPAEPKLPEDVEMILALDLDRLEPEDRVRFAREREAIRQQAIAQRKLNVGYVERYREALQRRRS